MSAGAATLSTCSLQWVSEEYLIMTFSVWSFEISKGILRLSEIALIDSFSNQRFIYLTLFG